MLWKSDAAISLQWDARDGDDWKPITSSIHFRYPDPLPLLPINMSQSFQFSKVMSSFTNILFVSIRTHWYGGGEFISSQELITGNKFSPFDTLERSLFPREMLPLNGKLNASGNTKDNSSKEEFTTLAFYIASYCKINFNRNQNERHCDGDFMGGNFHKNPILQIQLTA